MKTLCRINLFGEMSVSVGERVHTRFRTHKAAYLLAYLALHPQQTQPRERLAELFWADKEPDAARDGLSTALAQLRRQLETDGVPPGAIFLADRQNVQLNPETTHTDVAEFERLLRQAQQTTEKTEQIARLRQAAELYRGELLPGCYEEWAAPLQAHYQSLSLDALRRLMRLLEEADQYAEALSWAQKATLADPYAEEIYRAQMRLLVRLRQPSVALQTYERLEQIYRRDLGATPSPATRQMADTIREDPRALALLRAEATAAAQPVGSPPPAPAPEAPPPSLSAPALPLQLTRFFGRIQEQEQLKALLETPGTRLVSILGPGGAGKTRLAVEVGAQLAAAFGNRVWFVPLADIPDASLIASVLVNSLHVPSGGATDPLERVIQYLGDRPCLLILDNLEHLLREGMPGKSDNASQQGSTAVVRLLLARVPGLVCLATSRLALRLEGEQEFLLPPLSLPAQTVLTAGPALLDNESVALYVDRARIARLDFAVTDHNAQAIATLCRRLEGMPLAIEMAAAWAKAITPQKMLERLEHQLDLLVSRRRDLPPRHQSLRATIEWSYDLLAPDLRRAFAALSVFRGGWTLEAAEAVLGTKALSALLALQEHSLILALDDAADETRYRMLEPLREFARERLAEMDSDAVEAHARFFLEMTLAYREEWDGPDQLVWLDRLEREIDNLRAVLDYFAADPAGGLKGLQMIAVLQRFMRRRGLHNEARVRLERALAHPGAQEPTQARVNALNGAGGMAWMQGDYATATEGFTQALNVSRTIAYTHGTATSLGNLSILAEESGALDRARQLCEESLTLYQQLGDQGNIINCLVCLANVANSQHDSAGARSYFEQAMRISRETGDHDALVSALNGLIYVCCGAGDLDAARRYLVEMVPRCRELQNPQENAAALQGAAILAGAEGHFAVAARLWGAASRMRRELVLPLAPNRQQRMEDELASLRLHLGAAECEALLAEGDAYTWEQAMEEALDA